MAKNIRSTNSLLDSLVKLTDTDILVWKRVQPNLFESTFLGRKIEVEWDNGDDAAFYLNDGDKPIKGDLERVQGLYKSITEQWQRKHSRKRNLVRDFLRDVRKYETEHKRP
ncbi:MAG: hypothetical protein Q8L24_00270 [bacterium]|nr:hypothetical protein [bacterium]